MAKCEGGVELSRSWELTSDVTLSKANIIAPDGAPAVATRRYGHGKIDEHAPCALQESLNKIAKPKVGRISREALCKRCDHKTECIKFPSP
jgi:hypothetical protein